MSDLLNELCAELSTLLETGTLDTELVRIETEYLVAAEPDGSVTSTIVFNTLDRRVCDESCLLPAEQHSTDLHVAQLANALGAARDVLMADIQRRVHDRFAIDGNV